MKKLILLILCFSIFGCAAAGYNNVPAGKTENDWGTDEAYCLKRSHRLTGFWLHTPPGLAWNIGYGADKKNEECLKELGWIK